MGDGVSVARLVIGWTILFIWGLAYLMPPIPMAMLIWWTWCCRRLVVMPFLLGAAFVLFFYAYPPP